MVFWRGSKASVWLGGGGKVSLVEERSDVSWEEGGKLVDGNSPNYR